MKCLACDFETDTSPMRECPQCKTSNRWTLATDKRLHEVLILFAGMHGWKHSDLSAPAFLQKEGLLYDWEQLEAKLLDPVLLEPPEGCYAEELFSYFLRNTIAKLWRQRNLPFRRAEALSGCPVLKELAESYVKFWTDKGIQRRHKDYRDGIIEVDPAQVRRETEELNKKLANGTWHRGWTKWER